MLAEAVSTPDGHLVAVAGGRLTAYALATRRAVASTEVVGDHLVSVGSAVLVHARDSLASLLTLMSVPDLTALACIELAAPTRLLAGAGTYALVDRGDQAFLVQTAGGNLAVLPLRPPAAFARAFGLDPAQLVTFGERGTEIWDPGTRAPQARLALPWPDDTVEAGATLRSAALWLAGAAPELTLARLSDGRLSTVALAHPPRDVRGHRAVSWLVATVGAEPVAINAALRTVEPLVSAAGPIVALAPVPDREICAHAIAIDGDRLHVQLLGGDSGRAWSTPRATPDLEEDAPAGPGPIAAHRADDAPAAPSPTPAPSAPTKPPAPRKFQTVSDRLAARNAIPAGMGTPGPTAAPPSPPSAAPSPPGPARSASLAAPSTPGPAAPSARPALSPPLAAPSTPRPAAPSAPPALDAPPAGLSSAGPAAPSAPAALGPSLAAPPTAGPAAPPPARTIAPGGPTRSSPILAAAAPTGPGAWRDELLRWVRAPGQPCPALASSPLRDVLARVPTGPATWPIACALYAAWLEGDSERGRASAQLAALAAPADDRWTEALGGALAASGLAWWDHGRAHLATAVGDFLDDRPPQLIEVVGRAGPARRPPPTGCFRHPIATTVRDQVVALADQLGAVGFYHPLPSARLALRRARLEAWLHRLPLITTVPTFGISVRADECLVWLAPDDAQDHPAAPPPWPA
ncbi:MAG: hypothetical protein IPL61_02050 [Myxococcales bacterium]|nr:hypothetical protein [Myxococcales bacterium]